MAVVGLSWVLTPLLGLDPAFWLQFLPVANATVEVFLDGDEGRGSGARNCTGILARGAAGAVSARQF